MCSRPRIKPQSVSVKSMPRKAGIQAWLKPRSNRPSAALRISWTRARSKRLGGFANALAQCLELLVDLRREAVAERGQVLLDLRKLPANNGGVDAQQRLQPLLGEVEIIGIQVVRAGDQAETRLADLAPALAATEDPFQNAT